MFKWKSEPVKDLAVLFQQMGYHGNIKARQKFTFMGETYYLMEAQLIPNKWGTWTIHLCNSECKPIKKLSMKTPKGSLSFTNPNITLLHNYKTGYPMLACSYFLPSEGNYDDEAGSCAFTIDITDYMRQSEKDVDRIAKQFLDLDMNKKIVSEYKVSNIPTDLLESEEYIQ